MLAHVHCQVSSWKTLLPDRFKEGSLWRCPGDPYSPGCTGTEVYAVADEGLQSLAVGAVSKASRLVATPADDDVPSVCVLGVHPECITGELDDGRKCYTLYVARNSDRGQMVGELFHEAMHRVLPWKGGERWIAEMLADCFRVLHLAESGFLAEAQTVGSYFFDAGSNYTVAELYLNPQIDTIEREKYGRAFMTGWQIGKIVGFGSLFEMGTIDLDDDYQVAKAWLQDYCPPGSRAAAKSLLLP